MTKFEVILTVLASVLVGTWVVVPQIFLLVEIRKLFRQVRHVAEVYFPEHINKAAAEKPKGPLPTSVEVNDSLNWPDEDEEGRPVVGRD